MASSPPYSAGSPPLANLSLPSSLPKKRPSLGLPSDSHSKRRKPSVGPSGLRQTSFPPENSLAKYSRSPSVDSSVVGGATPSIISSAAGGAGSKRKRGKKGKAGEDVDDTRSQTAVSVRGGKAGSAVNGAGGSAAAGRGGTEEPEEDEAEGEAVDLLMEGGKMDEAAAKQEREHLQLLMEAFTPDQDERYTLWKRVKLRKETVRKITNHTLSQSVPASVVTTINGYTKVFIGELIERARQVQLEWMASNSSLPTGELLSPEVPIADRIKVRDRGPLAPDHLREALRRYKKDTEGGGAGFAGLSLEGRENTAARMGGRKLFR